jgi:hypothetical protein
MEGWVWLEREGFIAVKPNDQFGLQYFVTRKGDRVAATENFEAYEKASMFPVYLDAALVRMVKPLFVRGDTTPQSFGLSKTSRSGSEKKQTSETTNTGAN